MSEPDATLTRALALHNKGFTDKARDIYKHLLTQDPRNVKILELLSQACWSSNDSGKALYYLRQAIEYSPHNAHLYCEYGTRLLQLDAVAEALDYFRRALHVCPDSSEALLGAAKASRLLRKDRTALSLLHTALKLQPDSFSVHANLGMLYNDMADYERACTHLARAVNLHPSWTQGHNLLGIVYMHRHEYDAAASAFSQAIQLDPDNAVYRNNRARSLFHAGDISGAAGMFSEALQIKNDFAAAHSNLLYTRTLTPGVDAHELFKEHSAFNTTVKNYEKMSRFTRSRTRDPDRPLRIGYLSPGLRAHPVGFFMMPVFSRHTTSEFECVCYADIDREDGISEFIARHCHRWRVVNSLSDEQLYDRIFEDDLDMLIDLDGHCVNNRLAVFAARAAPVQISYLAYPATTGLHAMDYYIADTVTDTAEDAAFYSETLMRMDPPFFAFRPRKNSPSLTPLPALNNGFFSFGSLHPITRLNEDVLSVWARILTATDSSRLVVFRTHMSESFRTRLRSFFADNHIDSSRIEILTTAGDNRHYLDVCERIDLALDTFPWSGHTTATELLWMGIPTITWHGDRHCARMVSSLLHSCGLDEFITHSKDEYVDAAVSWASRIPRLSGLRESMRERMLESTVMDEKGFTRKYERTLKSIWEEYCRTQA